MPQAGRAPIQIGFKSATGRFEDIRCNRTGASGFCERARQWVAACARQLRGLFKHCRRNARRAEQFRFAECQRSSLVEYRLVDFCKAFKRIARFYQHAAFEQSPGRNDLNGGHSQPKRAGADDDQNRDRVCDRIGDARAGKPPDREHKQRHAGDKRNIRARRAIGEANIAASGLLACFQ